MTNNNLKRPKIDNLTIPDTEDTKELADMAVEQFARFFWEYWRYMKGLEENAKLNENKAKTQNKSIYPAAIGNGYLKQSKNIAQ